MWILLGIFIIAHYFTGVRADESRTALIVSGCVAGALLLISLGVLALIFILRYRSRKEKMTLPRHDELNANGFHSFFRDPGNSMSTNTSVHHISGHRSQRTKAFTQHAAHPRYRPPVAFYTMRADSRMHPELPGIISMTPPGHTIPRSGGQPVVFLDWNGAPAHATNDESYKQETTNNLNKSRRHKTRDEPRDSREKLRSKSHSRSRETLIVNQRRNSSSNLPSLSAKPGDLIMQTRNGGPEIQMRNTKESYDSNNNRFQSQPSENEIQTTSFMTSSIIDNSTTPDITNENKYVVGEGPYSITQLHTNPTILPSTINTSQRSYTIRQNGVSETKTILRELNQEPITIPKQDYPNDTPRSSDIFDMNNAVVTKTVRIDMFSANTQDVVETPWVELPKLNVVDNIYEETTTFENNAISNLTTTAVQMINHSWETKYEHNEDILTNSHRQDSNFTQPPSPPSEVRPPTPPFDAESLIYPKTLPIIKNIEDKETNNNRLATPPPDMSPISDMSNNDMQDQLTNLQMFSSRNVKHRAPTPPPGMTNDNGMEFDIDDIINIREERSFTTASEHISFQDRTHNKQPFMDELKHRQRSIVDEISDSPPPPSLVSKLKTKTEDLKDRIQTARFEEEKYDDFPPIPKNVHNNPPKKHSGVQFSKQPPEIIERENSHDHEREPERDQPSNNFWKEIESTNSLISSASLPHPPPPPAPPPPPPLPPLK